MNGRMSGQDHSLNAPLKRETTSEWQDWLIDDKSENQEEKLIDSEDYKYRKSLLGNALTQLNERERFIFTSRRINEKVSTLEELSEKFGVSRERIRQIEVRAFEKVQNYIKRAIQSNNNIELLTLDKKSK